MLGFGFSDGIAVGMVVGFGNGGVGDAVLYAS
jgi:hypothetical protein